MYSPKLPTVISASCTTYATTDVSVYPSGTTYSSIVSSSFKLDSNSRMMTLLLNNLSTSIGLISECATQWFVGVYILYKSCGNMYKRYFYSRYEFWGQPTQDYYDGFGIYNHSNVDDVLKIFDVVFLLICFLDQSWAFNWREF